MPTLPPPPLAPQPLEAIAGFVALLRDHGLKVGAAEQVAFVRSAMALTPPRSKHLSGAWRAIACHNPRDWKLWPELFERYWHPERLKGQVKISGRTRPSRDLRQVMQTIHDGYGEGAGDAKAAMADSGLAGEAGADAPSLSRAQGGASRVEALDDRSLSQWLPQDLQALEALTQCIADRLRRRLTRRWEQDREGPRLDFRRTLRASLRTGGVPIAPVWRRLKRERPRLFILVDVSRSMQTHAQLFLRIARAFVGAAHARVFVFHTRLAEVTPLLRSDSGAVQEKVNAVTAGFGGGTRIATSVADFHRSHARAQLGRGSRVWMLSDGFDADPPGELAQELRRVRGRGARITWFHPTAGRPTAGALGECAPLIDRFVPLSSLRDLSNAALVLN